MFFKQLIHLKLCIIIEATFLLALLEAEIDMARGVGEYLEEKKKTATKNQREKQLVDYSVGVAWGSKWGRWKRG